MRLLNEAKPGRAGVLAVVTLVCLHATAWAQPASPPPKVVSPEVKEDKHVVFRLFAPKAEAVRLVSMDMPSVGFGKEMTKGDNGVWEITVGPVAGGTYRYGLNLDGVMVADSLNPDCSQSNMNIWSLLTVPGSDISDLKQVPHGAVAEVTYYSQSLDRFRRMHVYTPPGYELGEGQFPVLYLLHGATDSDDSWSTIGRAGIILDNLIAAGKAKPMIVVMPHGHTGPFEFGPPRDGNHPLVKQMAEFLQDFVQDLKPFAEKHYRVRPERSQRAVAGLSMGGAQTLDIAMANLDQFAYLGVFSSGVFGIAGGPFATQSPSWEEKHQQTLENAELKKDLKLVWFATGKEDFLLDTTKATVKMLQKHGFEVEYHETAGGHTWINWRQYLADFAPRLFQ